MDTITEIAYTSGFRAGKSNTVKRIFTDIEDVLETCAHDNGEMIVRALKKLKEEYEEEIL